MKLKIAVPANGENLEATISPVFGRCPYFLIIEVENKEIKNFKAIKNPAAQAFGGAGIQAAQVIANEGVDTVICGNIGPNAFNALNQLGIKVYAGFSGVIKDIVDKFLKGEIQPTQPTFPAIKPGRGFGYGGPTECVCPNCGFRVPHQRGIPCAQHICPRCGSRMVRGN